MIVPLAAGGGTDALARIVAQKLSAKFGQSVIVENRAGGAGNIGTEVVFRSSPDGHTLLFTQPAPLTVNAALYGRSPFEAEKFVPIAMVSAQDIMLAINPNVPAKDLAELIAYAKANPNKLNYGSSGVGTAPHLAAELFKLKANVDMVHVPYKGSAEFDDGHARRANRSNLFCFQFRSIKCEVWKVTRGCCRGRAPQSGFAGAALYI